MYDISRAAEEGALLVEFPVRRTGDTKRADVPRGTGSPWVGVRLAAGPRIVEWRSPFTSAVPSLRSGQDPSAQRTTLAFLQCYRPPYRLTASRGSEMVRS
jgi:hypothetical protein